MFKKRLNNRYTGIYRTHDDINNLKIRVTLKKLFSIIYIPKFEKIQTSASYDEPSTDFAETIELKWQEKILSKTEMNYFGQKENCKSELEKKYHQMIKDKGSTNQLIFTYIHDDGYHPKQMEQFSKIQRQETHEATDEELDQRRNSGIFEDSKLTKRAKSDGEFSEMHIMADLQPSILLFSIKYRKSDGLFIIYPDFNEKENCYFLEIDQSSKQMYTYNIENISKFSNKITKKFKQKQKLNELMSETCEIMNKMASIPKDFEGVNIPKCRFLIIFEIVSAERFEYDNVHIQYKLRLPKALKLVEGQLEGSTHSSFINKDVWLFGYCFSIVVDVENEFCLSSIDAESFSVVFTAISIDSLWLRERHEGTATLKLPLESLKSSSEYNLQCLRYIQNGSLFTDMLERFFLGGIRSLNQCPSEAKNFYGNLTVTTGFIKVKVQHIRQIQNSFLVNTRMKSIDSIIDSYHKVKSKLNL